MYIYYNIYKYIKKNAVRSGGGSEGPPRPGLGRLRRRATRVSCLWLPSAACDTGELPATIGGMVFFRSSYAC